LALAVLTLTVAITAEAFQSMSNIRKAAPRPTELMDWAVESIFAIEDEESFERGQLDSVPGLGDVEWRGDYEEAEVPQLFRATLEITFEGDWEVRRERFVYRPGWAWQGESADRVLPKVTPQRESRR